MAVPETILSEPGPLEELQRSAGTRFDPVVVEVFVALSRESGQLDLALLRPAARRGCVS